MAGNVGIASTQIIDELFKSIDTAWTAEDWTQNPFCEKVSYYATGSKGKFKVVPLVNASSYPKVLGLGMDREFKGAEVFKVEVEHKTIVPTGGLEIFTEQLRSDVYDVLMLRDLSANVIKGARQLFPIELAKTIVGNGNSFDGVSHINTAHPVNPLVPALGTYSNDAGAADLDEAGVAAALQLLSVAPDFTGQPDPTRLRKIAVIVPSVPLYLKAVKLFGVPIAGAGLLAAPGTAAGTSVAVNSPFSFARTDFQFEIVYEPLLVQVGGNAKHWYLANVSSLIKPWVTSIVEFPVLAMEGMSANDHLRVQKLALRATYDAFGGCANGHPREVVRATAP